MIRAGLLFDTPHSIIRQKLRVSEDQIKYAECHRPTPQKQRGRLGKVKLRTPQRRKVDEWLQASPSHKFVPWRRVPNLDVSGFFQAEYRDSELG